MGHGHSKFTRRRESFTATADTQPPSYTTTPGGPHSQSPGNSSYHTPTSDPPGGLMLTTADSGDYAPAMLDIESRPGVSDPPAVPVNIVVFGSVGSGKSAVINMLARAEVAKTSNGAVGCGEGVRPYEFFFDESPRSPTSKWGNKGQAKRETRRGLKGRRFVFWDTPGLDEPESGSVPNRVALEKVYGLLVGTLGTLSTQEEGQANGQLPEMMQAEHSERWLDLNGDAWANANASANPNPNPNDTPKGGINLLIFCVQRGRVTDNVLRDFKIVHEVFCRKQVPVLLVVTGLEEEGVPRDWWVRPENRGAYTGNGIVPNGVVCVCATRGKRRLGPTGGRGYVGAYEKEWEASRKELEREVLKTYLPKGWEASPVQWATEPSPAGVSGSGGTAGVWEWMGWVWGGLRKVNSVIGASNDDVEEEGQLTKWMETDKQKEGERKVVVDGDVKIKLVDLGFSDAEAGGLARHLALTGKAGADAGVSPNAAEVPFASKMVYY